MSRMTASALVRLMLLLFVMTSSTRAFVGKSNSQWTSTPTTGNSPVTAASSSSSSSSEGRTGGSCGSVADSISKPRKRRTRSGQRSALSMNSDSSSSLDRSPQVFATGYSPKLDLLEAIQDATDTALRALPKPTSHHAAIDLAIVTISSLYDGGSVNPSVVVPSVLSSASVYGRGIQTLVGCTSGGMISSVANYYDQYDGTAAVGNRRSRHNQNQRDEEEQRRKKRGCVPVESEGVPGVTVTLCLLPDVHIKTFHVLGEDVPDDIGRVSSDTWKKAVGLRGWGETNDENAVDAGSLDGVKSGPPVFMLIPSPAFQNDLGDLVRGLTCIFPKSLAFGGIASTVSSLSRARLFRYDASDPNCIQTLADGCVGVAMKGDLEVRTMIAQGAKPVGGVYRIVSGSGSTIGVIVLDDTATEEAQEEEEEEGEDEDSTASEDEKDEGGTSKEGAKARMAAAYAKARIPKPVLAEANFLMRTLSDDDQSFMRKALLIGIERGGSIGRTPSELVRLAKGEGHRFTVHQVASAGMKDGSVTFPLESVDVRPGTRVRFFVREGKFAKKEVEAIWTGYKKRSLAESFSSGEVNSTFNPTGCLIFSTLDRGAKLFGGRPGYESDAVSTFLPGLPSISGFYTNGVLGRLDDTEVGMDTMVHGSAACYALFGSRTGRPVYSPEKAAAAEAAALKRKEEEEAAAKAIADEDEKRKLRAHAPYDATQQAAPRSEDGELVLKRREVHSGRAISVSTVEWSVAEKTATPTSALEGFMWDKETEVDRFRERVPLSNLMSQCKLAMHDPSKPKPRDWVGPVKLAGAGGNFVIIPECKRMEPTSGSLRKRYDIQKLVRQLTSAGAPAISVNCDSVLFGGSIEDLTKAREASSSAAAEAAFKDGSFDEGVIVPPILASDLLLYPYQLYKLRLAGADAVNLVAGALASKDLLYLTKIASSVQLQTVVSVTSEVQIRTVSQLSKGSVSALVLSNRDLEHFTFDESGEQALSLLSSVALAEFRAKHGEDVPVLVEGRVGIIERADVNGVKSTSQYLKELKQAGAFGAIIGGGLASTDENDGADSLRKLQTACQ